MAKHATLKDIIYATQFAGERLIYNLPEPPKKKPRWTLSVSGVEVADDVAEKFRAHPCCCTVEKNTYGWRAA